MKYDIYFHNDFDGRASAAVMLAVLRSRGEDIGRYVAMTYGKEGKWYAKGFLKRENPAIVVDFTYHPNAAWWFDHHASAFKKPEWKKHFKADARHRLDPRYASCCRLVYATLRREFKWNSPKHFRNFIRYADKIDGAGYASARETIEMKDPGIQMNAYIEALPHAAKEDARMIRLMAARPLPEVVKDPSIARAIAQLKKKVAQSMAYSKKHLRVTGRSTFIDVTKDPMNGLLRYAPYYLHPKILYSARMRRKGKIWYLGIGANPWRRAENKLNLGSLMRRYRGGGHKNVGATEFKTHGEAMRAFHEINSLLNR